MRQYGGYRDNSRRYKWRPGIYAILEHKNCLLLTYQGAEHQEFQLPGGGIDEGESRLQALHREVREETGWRIDRPRYLTTYLRRTYMPDYGFWAEKVCHIYTGRAVQKISEPTEADHAPYLVPIENVQTVLSNDIDLDIISRLFRH